MSKTRKMMQYVLLAVAVAGLGYFASLHMSQQRPMSQEEKVLRSAMSDGDSEVAVLKSGAFNPDARGSDGLHRGSGDVALVNFMGKDRLVFMDNFHVTNGPDYKVYLLGHSDIQSEKEFKPIKQESHQLDSLVQFSGFQVFTLPPDMDPDEVQSVLVWCEAFSEFISNADLL